MEEGEHTTQEGLKKILSMKGSINWGLPDKLKEVFPNVVQWERPVVRLNKIQDPRWVAGFTAAEGCFMVNIKTSKTHSVGFQVYLKFQLTQHYRDEELMISLEKFFGCGHYFRGKENREWGDFQVTKFNDIQNKIIPFFKEYPILGVKALDFQDWCKVADIMAEKRHLTQQGLEEIRKIK